MAIHTRERKLAPEGGTRTPQVGDSSRSRAQGFALIALCLVLGPVGMAYLDLKHGFLGFLTLAFFLGAAYLAWPALMPAFVAAGFLVGAYRAHAWIHCDLVPYRNLFASGFKSLFEPLPFFLPLLLDLSMLVLLESLLRQAWMNRQRGSMPAALAVACFSTPVLMLGARALGKALVRKALRPYRAEG